VPQSSLLFETGNLLIQQNFRWREIMKRKAFEAAADALRRLDGSVDILLNARDIDEQSSAWTDVLIHSQRVFSKLAAGASGGSQQWWNGKTKRRKDDPLLAFAHEARHADEHGIEKIARVAKPAKSISLGLPDGKSGWLPDLRTNEHGEIVYLKPNDGQVLAEFGEPILVLKSVSNRGRTYQPPSVNGARPVSPQDLAQHLQSFLSLAVREAGSLIAD
jgi:hypothetical protein